MKNNILKLILLSFVCLPALSACGRLDTILYSPTQTPQTWLQIQPFATIHLGGQEIFLVQPSTSAIVYLLGILTIGIGLYVLKLRAGQHSRLWWGMALRFILRAWMMRRLLG